MPEPTPGAALVILPTYNEAGNIAHAVERIRHAAPEAHILVVDDGSPDGTGELADGLAASDAAVTVLHRPAKQGLGSAYLAGFAAAHDDGYEYVVEIDADGSHDPAELPAMLELAAGGADLVIGSRRVAGGSIVNWPRHRRTISHIGNAYAKFMLRSQINDLTAGYRVYRLAALEAIDLATVSSQGYCFQVELAWRLERAGIAVVEHPIAFVERESGRSKMHAGIVTEALFRVTGWGIGSLFERSKRR